MLQWSCSVQPGRLQGEPVHNTLHSPPRTTRNRPNRGNLLGRRPGAGLVGEGEDLDRVEHAARLPPRRGGGGGGQHQERGGGRGSNTHWTQWTAPLDQSLASLPQ